MSLFYFPFPRFLIEDGISEVVHHREGILARIKKGDFIGILTYCRDM